MRILIISYYFPPVKSVASERIRGFATHLQSMGHNVEVLTTQPSSSYTPPSGVKVHRVRSAPLVWLENTFSSLRSENQATNGTPHTPRKIGVLARLNRFRARRGMGYLGRMPDVTDFWYLSARSWLRKREAWDCVICSYAPYSSIMLGLYAKKHNKCHMLVTDFRDLWSQHHLFRGLFPFTLLERYLEKNVLAAADLVTTVSEELRRELEKLSRNRNTLVVSNGHEPPPTDGFSAPKDSRTLTLVYTGTVYPRFQSLGPLLATMKKLNRDSDHGKKPIRLLLAGGGKDELLELAEKCGVSDSVMHDGVLDYSEALAMQHSADLLLYVDFSPLDYDGVVPTKLFEYASSGIPVLFLRHGKKSSAARFMEECGTTIFVINKESDVEEFFQQYRNGGLPARIKPNAAFINRYTRYNQVRILENALSEGLDQLVN